MESRNKKSSGTAALFVVLALGFAWLYWASVACSRAGILHFSIEKGDGFLRSSVRGTLIWAILSGFGPAIAGIIAVAVGQGHAGLARLGWSVVRWQIPVWLYIAGLFGLAPNLALVLTGLAIGQTQFAPSVSVERCLLFFFLMIFLDGPMGEEIGWRGVLLPQLLKRWNALGASFIVAVIWYLWHIPIYLADERTMDAGAHVVFLYTCVALSILLTWLFIRSAGSTLLAIYAHNCSNYFTFVRFKTFSRSGPSNLPIVAYLVVLTLLAIAAAIALWRARDRSSLDSASPG